MIWLEEWHKLCLQLFWVDNASSKGCKLQLNWKLISLDFSGRQIDGIWHTGVVAYGREYFFGGGGIQSCPPVSTFFLYKHALVGLIVLTLNLLVGYYHSQLPNQIRNRFKNLCKKTFGELVLDR